MRRRSYRSIKERELSSLLCGRIPMTALVQTFAVAEYLNFHRAAQAPGTSPLSVSARIKGAGRRPWHHHL